MSQRKEREHPIEQCALNPLDASWPSRERVTEACVTTKAKQQVPKSKLEKLQNK
jgi:hypothetical protein